MSQRVKWPLGLIVVFLAGVGATHAGVQVRATVCWLGTGDWQLREENGKVFLAECDWQRWAARLEGAGSSERYRWQVSAPTIRSQSGKFLGSDPEGRTSSVYLLKDKGANTHWVFDIVEKIRPDHAKGECPGMKAGPSGFQFRVKMAEGHFKDWYLATEKLDPEPKHEDRRPATRRLKLVRDVKKATIFTYIDKNYSVDHK